ncbi:4Fe-4S dicluster domain-containing protein [Maribellus sp. YY47]|uniref:4Fe-4S dicluster domain-containing protein n=1 Tax=Maribellus sp. YY47 TaxID=2929486 RepID=UPI0020018329|nr:4Fe-4S dicluster domain-containing protein [Maribellus sp. YY47]MCK3683591.1 4Fe-4S dicluster domain-containing protein [Maribellus sp. YY47]
MKKSNSRRSFLKNISLASASALALSGCSLAELEKFFQKNFRTLSEKERKQLIEDLEAEYKQKYHKEFHLSDKPAIDGTLFGYALDISRCIGCRKCVYACVEENNQSREPQIHWIQVLQMEKEKGIDFVHSDVHYNPETVPEEGHFYLPVQCQQCRTPQCTTVCPVKATWQEPDGIVVVDYNWCIGCRYCMAACPYGARHFNWGKPEIPEEEINTEMHYLGNRPRMKGVVEKCTFCIQRVREGRYPACVEVCPVGARKFGNLLDPNSEIRYILENKRVLVLKEELNTQPKFYYFFGV